MKGKQEDEFEAENQRKFLEAVNFTREMFGRPPYASREDFRRAIDAAKAEADKIVRDDEGDDEDGGDDVTCSTCCGTGEGMHDGASCRTCGGGGGESIASRRAARAEYLADCDDGT